MLNEAGVEDPLHSEVSSSSLGELQVNEGTGYITWSKKYRNNKHSVKLPMKNFMILTEVSLQFYQQL